MVSPVVLISPAMAIGSNFYRPVVKAFEAHGWTANSLPRRGFERDDARASRDNDWSYADETHVLTEAVRKARAQYPDRPVLVLGHSLGGHLAAANQLHGEPADALVTIGSGLPWVRHYGWTSPGVAAIGAAVWPLTHLYGYVPKPAFGAPGPRTMMTEWARMILHNRLPFDVPTLIDSPTLVIHLQGDTYASSGAIPLYSDTFIDPDALTPWMYAKSAVPPGGTTNHIRWVRTPQPVVDQVVQWWAANSSTGGHEQTR